MIPEIVVSHQHLRIGLSAVCEGCVGAAHEQVNSGVSLGEASQGLLRQPEQAN